MRVEQNALTMHYQFVYYKIENMDSTGFFWMWIDGAILECDGAESLFCS